MFKNREPSLKRGLILTGKVIVLIIALLIVKEITPILIQKVMEPSRHYHDSTLIANLQIIRNAIEMYKADVGAYPVSRELKELYIKPANVPAKKWKGPYLKLEGAVISNPDIPIPVNPDVFGSSVSDHWTYNPATGRIIPNPNTNGGKDADGKPYSSY